MLNELFERQAALQAQANEYAPIRMVFEEFLKAGRREDAGFLWWWTSPGPRRSRYNWERKETIAIPGDERTVVVEALTDFQDYRFGHKSEDIEQALINVNVSLSENPNIVKKSELLPIWAILEHSSDFSPQELDKLGEDLEDIIPLVRACLPQG